MLTQAEITAYVEQIQRSATDKTVDASEQWERLQRRLLIPPPEKRLGIEEWYREYEEQTGTLLGCD